MTKIPRIVHYVFGMREQTRPFHLLHYLAIESSRRVLQPERIYLYYHHLPFGLYWDMISPHLTLVRVAPATEVSAVQYDDNRVPEQYRYAHHADVIRLDALIEHGGIYADIDTLFLRPLPEAFYRRPFVISREAPVVDERSGELQESLCNAVMMAAPGSAFACTWRERIGAALNGTWSNHSCLLARRIAEEYPEDVHVEPPETFLGVPLTPDGLQALLEGGELDVSDSYCIHLWQHVWWEESRTDFCRVHAQDLTLRHLRNADTPLAQLARPFLPQVDLAALGPATA